MSHAHAWWYLARASGLVSWGLLSFAVIWGLLLSTRVLGRSVSPRWLTDLHRFLGGIALVFTGLHVAALVGDTYVHFGLADVLVPFASGWRPVAVAWGVISLWVLIAVEVTSLLMKRLPRRGWHAIHLSSYALFATATVHALTAGTDTPTVVFLGVCAASLGAVLVLTLVRITEPQRPAPASAAAHASSDDRLAKLRARR